MSDDPESKSFEPSDQTGKRRTWWHPLLARMLDYSLASGYTVQEEVLVGKIPLRVDILLVRREREELSEAKRTALSALLPLLNRFTLIEFKGPTDSMEQGDFAQLVGCSYLWLSQQSEAISHDEVSLIVLAPSVNLALIEEIRLLGFETKEYSAGIFSVANLTFKAWLIETDIMAEIGQPVLSLVSRVFLNDPQRIIDGVANSGHSLLLHYMMQQINQFHSLGKGFAMLHGFAEHMDEVEEDLVNKLIEGFTIEQRLRGLPPEERLRGLTPEQLLAGISEDDAERLRELLEQKQGD